MFWVLLSRSNFENSSFIKRVHPSPPPPNSIFLINESTTYRLIHSSSFFLAWSSSWTLSFSRYELWSSSVTFFWCFFSSFAQKISVISPQLFVEPFFDSLQYVDYEVAKLRAVHNSNRVGTSADGEESVVGRWCCIACHKADQRSFP